MFNTIADTGRGIRTDAPGADGAVPTFESENEAHARLATLYPVMV